MHSGPADPGPASRGGPTPPGSLKVLASKPFLVLATEPFVWVSEQTSESEHLINRQLMLPPGARASE